MVLGSTSVNGAQHWVPAPCDVCSARDGCLRCGEWTACRWTNSERIVHTQAGTFFIHGGDGAPSLPGEMAPVETPPVRPLRKQKAQECRTEGTSRPPPLTRPTLERTHWQPFPTKALPEPI